MSEPRSYEDIVAEISGLVIEADKALEREGQCPARGESSVLTHWVLIGSFTDFARECGARGHQTLHLSNGAMNNWMMMGLLEAALVNFRRLEASGEDD